MAAGLLLLSQGAEARVMEWTSLGGRRAVMKERFKKKYRHSVLDEKLTRARWSAELRGLLRARRLGVAVPAVFFADSDSARIVLERVEGKQLKVEIREADACGTEAAHEYVCQLLRAVGAQVARMHGGNLVHGDLTTSNIIVRQTSTKSTNTMQIDGEAADAPTMQDGAVPVFIDFGLSYPSTLDEDKAVDLYVLERAFTSAHAEDVGAATTAEPNAMFKVFLEGYKSVNAKNALKVIKRLNGVRMRGRKRTMVG